MSENIGEIIRKIEYYDGKFPKEELQILLDNPAETTPYLLRAIGNADEMWRKLEGNADYILPYYSLLMLAQFREKQAYLLIYQIFAQSDDDQNDFFGDFVTEDLDGVLASISGGDMTLINRLVENEKTDEFVRSAGIDAWLCLLAAGEKSRDETIAFFKTLFGMPSEPQSFLRAALVCSCLDICATELLPEIEQSFDDDLVDETIIGWKYAERELLKDRETVLCELPEKHRLVTDMISDLERWEYFQEPQEFLPPTSNFLNNQLNQNSPHYQLAWDSRHGGTYVHETPKVGKNESCPCGSGRKYKKCCLN